LGGDNTGILVKYPAANISFTSAFDVFSIEVMSIIQKSFKKLTLMILSAGMDVGHNFRNSNCYHLSHFFLLTKRLRINVDENKPEIRAGTIMMYFFGNTFSQGKFYLK
jgi:hypothetical protein